MKEEYEKGRANRSNLKPYAGDGNGAGVAWARSHPGRQLSVALFPVESTFLVLRDHLFNHLAADIGQAEIAAGVAIG